MSETMVTALMTLATVNEPDEPTLILGDQPGDVETVLSTGGPPVLLADGRLLMFLASGEKGEQKCQGRYSTDHGLTWGEPVDLFDFPADKGSFGVGTALVSRKGSVHVWGLDYYHFNFQEHEQSRSYLWHASSIDHGKTLSELQYVPFGAEYTGSVNNACELSSGRILAPISYLSNRPTGVWVSVAPHTRQLKHKWMGEKRRKEREGRGRLSTWAPPSFYVLRRFPLP